MGGYFQYVRDGAGRGAKGRSARNAVAASLAAAGLLDEVNGIARDLAETRIAADSGDLEAMREANDHISRLKAALAALSDAGVGKVVFNSALGEYSLR